MKPTEQASTPPTLGKQGKKRTMSAAARKKISESAKLRWANQPTQGKAQGQTQPRDFQGQLRSLIASTRAFTREELTSQVGSCIGPSNTIGEQADRIALRALVEVLDQATGQRTMTAGSIHG